MRRTRFRVPIVGFLTAAAVSLGAGQSMLAQSKGGQANRQANDQYNGPGIKGKMGSTKNTERWAAAIRQADMRANKTRKDIAKKGKG